jgi:hypothetical protein
MFKPIVYALALCAMAVSVGTAIAKSGGGSGSSMGTGMKNSSMPVSRQQYTDNKTQVGFKKMKILNCHQYPRGNGQGGTVMVTVCN